jgi:8-oxo-dGTP pyrophosphatase MutT (NUDIX family)
MANIEVGVVDVYVIDPRDNGWRVLVLQRALTTRCPGAWEAVHGSIEPGEAPEDAARREVREETGLPIDRLYSVSVQPFYVVKTKTVQLAVVFAAFVSGSPDVVTDTEHQAHQWLTVDEAMQRLFWPAERHAVQQIAQMLRTGDAGAAEDVLRVP